MKRNSILLLAVLALALGSWAIFARMGGSEDPESLAGNAPAVTEWEARPGDLPVVGVVESSRRTPEVEVGQGAVVAVAPEVATTEPAPALTPLILEEAGSHVKLSGIVLCNGEPFSNASVTIKWAGRSRGHIMKRTKVDDAGRFEITLDDGGDYQFHIGWPGGGGKMIREIRIPSSRTHEIQIAFSTGRILGHLLGPHGVPVVGFQVSALGHLEFPEVGTSYSSARTDEQGAFEFPYLLGGTYQLSAADKPLLSLDSMPALDLPYLGSAEIEDLWIVPGQTISDVRLVFTTAAAVHGQVTDRKGKPVASAMVECRPAGYRGGPGPSKWRTDPSGAYFARDLDAGEYQVRAIRKREISAWVPVTAKLNRTTRADLVLQRGAMVTLKASFDGEPLMRGYAQIKDTEGVTVVGSLLKNGSAWLGPLFPGTYNAVVSMLDDPKHEAQQTFTVAGKARVTLELELP